MNLNKLPWWKNDYKSEFGENGSGFFEYLSSNEFFCRLEKFPLKKGLLTFFLNNHVCDIIQVKLSNGIMGKTYRVAPFRDSINFDILINSNYSKEKKASTLIHECMHGIYRVIARANSSCIEKILNEYESNFYMENKEFSIELFHKYSKL